MDLLDPIRAELAIIRGDVEKAVKIALLREAVETGLARLGALDTKNTSQYEEALKALQGLGRS